MLYNLSLHLNAFYVTAAMTLAGVFVLISLIKEKKDERKRA
ncbi:hypothetical protein [Geotalea sp. SG265]|nr:hypothetical protein [Geotalea sp. SG265]